MLALSIRQPWAWLILHAGKDIENRKWWTRVRGRVLIHAAKGMTHDEYDWAVLFHYGLGNRQRVPEPEELPRGGIVGSVEVVDCLRLHSSPWKDPCQYGFVLRDPQSMAFRPLRGQLGFFDVPDEALA